ncbi:MAG: hypothetical protein DRJ03_25320 [Chloroflexi bacterium]|nr:MAG: hypothetical protein DRJ03_25320 [Chloroflexota bacterium]
MTRVSRIVRSSLFWLAVLYLAAGLAYALVTPVFEKPDEDGHYGYILYLREHHTLPPLHFLEGFASEYKQPPLYYFVASVLTGWLPDVAEPERLLATNPYMDSSVPGYREDNRNVFLHPPHVTPVALGARLVSLLFGLGTMVAAYYLALQLFPRQSLVPIATAAVVGFQPQFLYLATAVNNDAPIAFFGTLVILILMVRLQQGQFAHFAVSLGIVLGLASITKVSGLVFFPLAGLALLFIHRGFNRAFLRDGLVIVAVALLVGGWWYVRNTLLYGDPLSITTHTSVYGASRPFGSRIQHDLLSIEHTFWANPSRTFVSQMWLDKVIIWWGRISLALLVLAPLFHYVSRFTSHALIVLLSWPITFLILLITYWTQQAAWAYGRLLFPAIAPIGLLLVLGWWYSFPPRWRCLPLTAGAGIVVVISILVPFASIYPLYHPWREWTGEQVEYPVGNIYVEPETGTRIAQLVGYNLSELYVSPGAYLPVELCWRPLSQTDVPYTVFVQLLDLGQLDDQASPGVWGQRRTYPGLGNLPTDRWTPDRPFCDKVLVQVSPDTPTPLGVTIEVGFIDPRTDNRLQATSAEGDSLGASFLRGVPVLSSGELPAGEQPPRYILDDAIGLDRVEVERGENTITLTLTWQSLQPVSYDATTFVHLKDADGELLAQADRHPLGGRFPTSYWLPGQVVTDTIRLPLTSAYDGPLTLNVGMYTWPSLERLPVVDATGNPQRDNMIAVQISLPLPDKEVIIP